MSYDIFQRNGDDPATFKETVTTATPVTKKVMNTDTVTLVGTVPATATFTAEFTISPYADIDDASAVWVSSGITFTANATTAGQIAFPITGLRFTATTLDSTVQVRL